MLVEILHEGRIRKDERHAKRGVGGDNLPLDDRPKRRRRGWLPPPHKAKGVSPDRMANARNTARIKNCLVGAFHFAPSIGSAYTVIRAQNPPGVGGSDRPHAA